jgi:hypothetical protein
MASLLVGIFAVARKRKKRWKTRKEEEQKIKIR